MRLGLLALVGVLPLHVGWGWSGRPAAVATSRKRHLVGPFHRAGPRGAAATPAAGDGGWQTAALEQTQVAALAAASPAADGRGVRIAVLDTGASPTSPTLAAPLPDGRPRLVDLVDCTGSGLVQLQPAQPAQPEGGGGGGGLATLTGGQVGAAERKTWPPNPSGRWLLGTLAGSQVLPREAVEAWRAATRAALDAELQLAMAKALPAAAAGLGAAARQAAALESLLDSPHTLVSPATAPLPRWLAPPTR